MYLTINTKVPETDARPHNHELDHLWIARGVDVRWPDSYLSYYKSAEFCSSRFCGNRHVCLSCFIYSVECSKSVPHHTLGNNFWGNSGSRDVSFDPPTPNSPRFFTRCPNDRDFGGGHYFRRCFRIVCWLYGLDIWEDFKQQRLRRTILYAFAAARLPNIRPPGFIGSRPIGARPPFYWSL